jgi:hypothetical protein
MVVWFLILTIVTSDGHVKTILNTSSKPEYNVKESCEGAAKDMADQLQEKVGDKARIYWQCQDIKYEDIDRALPPRI